MKYSKKIYTFFFLLFAVILITAGDTFAQCAMCRATVENNVSNGDVGIAANLNLGILYMFVAPYLLFMVIAYLWYRKSRKNGKKIKTTGYSRG
ncbi:hypothetical protein AB9P05_01920 [Roseivirga sp. BDSF3-8]|uniref:hypothetical protein n=1 Tax=Roseivirga sp. BDSF3-8 TaxID=3241598 RepID=UPI0035327D3B